MRAEGAHPEAAAAGHSDFRLAETAKQRADEIIGGTDLPGQLIRGAGRADMGAVDLHRVAIDCTDVGTQLFQNLQTQRHIGDLGNIFNAADTVHHQCGGDDGNGGVFRAADIYFTKQGRTALYYILCQIVYPLLKRSFFRGGNSPGSVWTVCPPNAGSYPRKEHGGQKN